MSNWLDEKMSEMGRSKCPTCDNYFKSIGHHLKNSKKCEPEISSEQREVITGLLMGDGCINKSGGADRPYLVAGMTSPNYLELLNDEIFPDISTGVSLITIAEESARGAKERGLIMATGHEENYSDVYEFRTLSHSVFDEYYDWYKSGKKIWPADIELTPTVLKHWYCGDGYIQRNNANPYIGISMSNEYENTDKISNMFVESGLPSPNFTTGKMKNNRFRCEARFGVDESKKLWEYMGEPLPDFEYKWPNRKT